MNRLFLKMASALLISAGVSAGIPGSLSAQEQTIYKRGTTTLENTLPPSPDPASAVRYVDVPFSHSQGLAQYNVPVYNLKGRELNIPISLSYSTGGIKMDEVAGVAGLGWNLNAGGVITRTVMDMPDEFSSAGFSHQMPSSYLLTKLENMTNDNETMGYLRDIVWHRKDTSLDRYSYSVCGLSGTFVIDGNGNVRQLSGDGVLISYVTEGIKGAASFTITGPDGTVYFFDEKETGSHDGAQDHPFTPTSGEPDRWEAYTAWHLKSVTSRSGLETATFSYSQNAQWTRNVIARREALSVSRPSGGSETQSTSSAYNYIASTYTVPVLTAVQLSGFTATFTYSQDTGSSYHYVHTGQSSQNFPFRLTGIGISYSGSSLENMTVGTAKSPFDGRIVLNSLRLYKGGSLDDRWDFTYDTRTSQVSRYSQDWFGYYNGEDDSVPHTRGGVCPFSFAPPFNTVTLSGGFPDASNASYMSMLSASHDGALTRFQYEGNSVSVNDSSISSVDIGVRVKKIEVLDNDSTVKRLREFTYENPEADGPVLPVPALYTTTSASLSDTYSQAGLVSLIHNWTISLHEHAVTHEPSVYETRVSYGKVTEDVSSGSRFRPRLIIITPSTSKHRTVRCYSTSDTRRGYTTTISRFPSYWSHDYTSNMSIPSSVDPMTGIREGYADSGPASPALLTSVDEYSSEDGSTFKHVSKTEYTYETGDRAPILTDYCAVQVMQRIQYGDLQYQDIYHYPVYAMSFTGNHPVSERHIEYHSPDGSDEYTLTTAYVARGGMDKPVRVKSLTMSEGGTTREVSYIYADTGMTLAGSSALRSQHDLSTALKTEYRVWDGTSRPATPTKSIEKEYSSFTIGGSDRHLLKWTREFTSGVLSWSEEIKSRDCMGNVADVKSTGKPETVVLWSWNGLYPVAVVENTLMQNVSNAAGSQTIVNTLTQSVSPTNAQTQTVSNLRASSSLSGAHVTAYSWTPGIGITSITDPAGVRTAYEYDAHGRLAFVKDNDGNKTEGYVYTLLNDGGDGHLNMRARKYRDSSGTSYSEDIRWFNTLGLAIEDISIAGAGDGRDLIFAREGDFMLHDDVKIWLPYPVSNTGGAFQNNATSAASSFHSNSNAFWHRRYENSAHDRIAATAAPGFSGAHETTYSRKTVSSVPKYKWGTGGVSQSGTYASQELFDEVATDPDGKTSHTIRDHAGRVIAQWRGDDEKTFYIYDKKDQLRAVKSGGIAVSDTLNMWRYSYDSKGRLSSKGIPGCVRDSYAYDSEDRVILKKRGAGTERTSYSYDAFGRVSSTYIYDGGTIGQTLETHAYDTYPPAANTIINAVVGSWSGPAKGLRTYSSIAEVDGSGSVSGYTETAWLYDAKERPVWIITKYPGGNILREKLSYDFSGEVISDIASYTHGNATETLTTTSIYDIRGRLASQSSVLNTGGYATSSVSSQYSYDAMGRRSGRSTSITGGITLAITDTYTLQQQLSSRTVKKNGTDFYTETLGYDEDSPYSDVIPLYGGEISRRTDNMTGVSSKTVGYRYDMSGRLVREHGPSVNVTYSYDARGNILSVSRGSSSTDTYTYSGDRITTFARTGESVRTFIHDSFGRMTSDGLEGVTTQYNRLDLPGEILSGGTTLVNFSYLCDGSKTSALKSNGEGLVYRGPFTYRQSSSGALTFESAICSEGRLTSGEVLLQVTDHLGSVVAVMRGRDGALYGASEYDAFGKESSLTVSGSVPFPSAITPRDRFTGKEDQQPDFGISYVDFGARQFSSSIRRWMTPDPLSEKYYGISPYAYCAGNPVSFIDGDGLDLVLFGTNKSSVTFKTDLVDMSIDVGKLGVDWGGCYSFEGKETLSAALDLAGFFDPTGLADGANAVMLASEGQYLDALFSGLSLFPLGDVAKVPKIGKDIRIIHDAIEKADKGLHRPYIRKWVREAVEAKANKDEFGRFIDLNTHEPIIGKYDLGHVHGKEFRRWKAKAEAEGWTQKQFNDFMNDPKFYQIEDPHSNRSRKYEKK